MVVAPMYRPAACLVIIGLLLGTGIAHGARRDVVVMKNGDHFTGSVSKMEYGVLYVDTEYMTDPVTVDWLQVESIQATIEFQVALKNGMRAAGMIAKSPAHGSPGGDFTIQTAFQTITVASADVVSIESQRQHFWRQLKGSVDAGANFTSGNSQVGINSDANVFYGVTNWSASISFTSSFSTQSEGSETNIWEPQIIGNAYVGLNSYIFGIGDFLHSTEQQLDLRMTGGGGYGQFWIRTNEQYLRWVGGIVYTHEVFDTVGAKPAYQNIEAMAGLQGQLFRFYRYRLQSQWLVFPSLSDPGRVRMTTRNTLSVKLPNNFYSSLSFWDNYDSRPPVVARKNELGISSSLGWSF